MPIARFYNYIAGLEQMLEQQKRAVAEAQARRR